MTTREELFRAANEEQETRVTHIELFFDLVFVFAVTQLSHRLLEHLTPIGAFETLILLLAIWWVWVYTSWATNWLDPDQAVVRLMLIALMCAGVVPQHPPATLTKPLCATSRTYAAVCSGDSSDVCSGLVTASPRPRPAVRPVPPARRGRPLAR